MLIALRVWRNKWRQLRSMVAVRGDSVTMLTMVVRLKCSSPALGIIARELAFDV